jgi:hypothetical protein
MNKEIFLARLRRWVRDIGDKSEEYQHDNVGFEAFELRITDEEPTRFAGWIANGAGEQVGCVMAKQDTVDTVTVTVQSKDKTIWLSDCVTWLADLAGVQPPIDIDTVLTERQIEELPIPERDNQTNSRGGRKRLQSHQDAIQRLVDGQTRETNFYQWKLDYEEETGTETDEMESGASELYRKSVWKRFTGKN